MKKQHIQYLCLTLLFLVGSICSNAQKVPRSLQKCFVVMNSLRQVRATIEHQYSDIFRSDIDTIIGYFDFQSPDTLLGVQYYFKWKNSESRFDGKTELNIHHWNQEAILQEEPNDNHLSNSPGVSDLILIKKLLPQITDSSWCSYSELPVSHQYGMDVIPIKIELKNRFLGLEYKAFRSPGTNGTYMLYLNPVNHLPVAIDYAPNSQQIDLTRFLSYEFDWPNKQEIWTKDIVPDNYRYMTAKEKSEYYEGRLQFKIGQRAPSFELPTLEGSSFVLDSAIGQPILLEFWFPGCRGCVACIDIINDLFHQHKDSLQVLGIQFAEVFEKGVRQYIQEEKIDIPVLLQGAEVAKKYGVLSAPTFIFINREGHVVKAFGGCDEGKLKDGLRMVGL